MINKWQIVGIIMTVALIYLLITVLACGEPAYNGWGYGYGYGVK